MRSDQKGILLLTFLTLLGVTASNAMVAGAMEAVTLTKVVSNVTSNSNPVWSPNGNEILFSRETGLYKTLSNGSGEMKLTPTEPVEYSWAPDGTKILYTAFGPEMEPSHEMWVMNANGSGKKQLMNSEWKIQYSCTWFPSGLKIIYATVYDDMGINCGIINSNSSNKSEFGVTGIIGSIALSPDASKLAYVDREYYIRVLNLDQKNSISLSTGDLVHQTQSWQPQVWAPTSSQLVYCSNENGNWNIYTININGTGKNQLTSDVANDQAPVFSPDGSKIVFECDITGKKEIWIMDADGKNKEQLTAGLEANSNPVWSPDGTKIAFCSNVGGNYNIYTLSIPPQKPVVEFSASPTAGNAALNVTFTDNTKGTPTAWNWNFGDGTNSTVKSPKHTYPKAGNYTVTLTASNTAGNDTKTKSSYIKVGVLQKPAANFSSNVTSGNIPLTVGFTDKSKGTPTAWNWSFGDGTYSKAKNPAHTYNKAGKYNVSLTVKNAAGNSTVTKSGYINVTTALKASAPTFSAAPTSGKAPLKVQFTDKSTGTITSRKWSFGDGTYSTQKNPVHIYSKAGKYTATLTTKSTKGTKTTSKSITVSK
ncbi:MAG TPA: PKD domain-containing protein [Methanosarcina sp.]|nr:PKD domain-containing protein [Methanosarcina sp.]